MWGRQILVIAIPVILTWVSFGEGEPNPLHCAVQSTHSMGLSGTSLAMLGALIEPSSSRIPDVARNWIYPLGTAAFSISIAVNAIIASLIALKIFMTRCETRPSILQKGRVNPIRQIISIFNESGMLMLGCQVIWLVLFRRHNTAFLLVRGPIVMIYVRNSDVPHTMLSF